jgi:hypothetical protein
MTKNKKIITTLVIIVSVFISFNVKAKTDFLIRVHGGTGAAFFMPDMNIDLSLHGGIRLLLSANENQRYGIECSYMHTNVFTNDQAMTFISTGFVLEQRLFDWFVMAIGTIGYISLESGGGFPFGIITNLGWEPKLKGKIAPFITYRAEFLFLNNNFIQVSSLSAGVTFIF